MNGEVLAFTYGAIGRWVTYLSIVTVGGAAGYAIFVRHAWRSVAGDRAELGEARVLRIAVGGAVTLTAATLWRLYAQTYSIFGLDESVIQLCDRKVTIPMQRGTNSLNVAVAAGVFLYHFTQSAVIDR